MLRDMIFGGRRHFRELLIGSQEGIASNILAGRLKALVEQGMLTAGSDPAHKQKVLYSLTEPAIELIPVIAQLGAWGSRWLPVTEELAARARVLADGGPPLWQRFMAELREEHLGIPAGPAPGGRTVRERLQEAYLAAGGTGDATPASGTGQSPEVPASRPSTTRV